MGHAVGAVHVLWQATPPHLSHGFLFAPCDFSVSSLLRSFSSLVQALQLLALWQTQLRCLRRSSTYGVLIAPLDELTQLLKAPLYFMVRTTIQLQVCIALLIDQHGGVLQQQGTELFDARLHTLQQLSMSLISPRLTFDTER